MPLKLPTVLFGLKTRAMGHRDAAEGLLFLRRRNNKTRLQRSELLRKEKGMQIRYQVK